MKFDRQYLRVICEGITKHGGNESDPYFAKKISEATKSIVASLASGAIMDEEIQGYCKVLTAAMGLS